MSGQADNQRAQSSSCRTRLMPPPRLLTTRPVLSLARWLLPVSALLTLTGYFRPWIAHQAAGLAVLGLDLGELVKFLYPVQQGDIRLWREGFYLPLVAVSVSLSLNAFRRDAMRLFFGGPAAQPQDDARSHPAYGWPVRIGLLSLAVAAALNLLPPAWTPRLLAEPEFRLQSAALLLCLALAAVSPFAALLASPQSIVEMVGGATADRKRRGCLWQVAWLTALLRALFAAALAGAAIYFPLAQFQWILPTLADLYGRTPDIGWGPAVMTVGLAGLLAHGLRDVAQVVTER